MYGVKRLGCYLVGYEGSILEKGLEFQRIVLFKLDESGRPIKSKKLYFRSDDKFVVPKFDTEKEVRKFFKYGYNSKLQVEMVYKITEI